MRNTVANAFKHVRMWNIVSDNSHGRRPSLTTDKRLGGADAPPPIAGKYVCFKPIIVGNYL